MQYIFEVKVHKYIERKTEKERVKKVKTKEKMGNKGSTIRQNLRHMAIEIKENWGSHMFFFFFSFFLLKTNYITLGRADMKLWKASLDIIGTTALQSRPM